MDNKKPQYNDFLNEVNPAYRNFADEMNDFFVGHDCIIKIELAKNGYVVSYSLPKTKKVIVNYVFRKNGLIMRIYGDFVNKYIDLLETLPEGMINSIEKASVCKRLIDPLKCNSRCSMGYDFTVKNSHYQKCRYNSFMFEVTDENIPFIRSFVENELKERIAR